MWTKLQKLFTYRLDTVVGIDISASSVKVAEVGWVNGQPLLKAASIVDLPYGTMEGGHCLDTGALAAALRQAVHASGAKSRNVILGIGAPGLFLREVAYPAMSPEELAQAVKWDSEKHVTLEPDSYYLDFAVTGQGSSELEVKTLLAASPKEIIDSLVSAAKDAGLRPAAVDAEPLALYRTLVQAENAMVVDIGADMSTVTLFQGGCPAVNRAVPIGGKRFSDTVAAVFELEPSEAERFKQRQSGLLYSGTGEQTAIQRDLGLLATELAREASRTVQYYSMQHKTARVEKLVLTGGGAKLDNLSRYFTASVDMPVVIHEPLAAVAVSPNLDPQYVRNLSLHLGVAIGLALGGGVA